MKISTLGCSGQNHLSQNPKILGHLDRQLIYLSNDTKFMEFGSAVLEILSKNQLVDLSHFDLQRLKCRLKIFKTFYLLNKKKNFLKTTFF